MPSLNITRWMSRYNLPWKPIQKYLQAKAMIEKYQRIVLHKLQEKHRQGSFVNDSFGKLFMEYAEKEQLSEDEMLSELFLFIVAGMVSYSRICCDERLHWLLFVWFHRTRDDSTYLVVVDLCHGMSS